jgi:hypothetical protein
MRKAKMDARLAPARRSSAVMWSRGESDIGDGSWDNSGGGQY